MHRKRVTVGEIIVFRRNQHIRTFVCVAVWPVYDTFPCQILTVCLSASFDYSHGVEVSHTPTGLLTVFVCMNTADAKQ